MIREDRAYAAVCDQCGHEAPAVLEEAVGIHRYPLGWYHVTLEQQHRHGHGWFCTMFCVIHWVQYGGPKEALI